MTDKPNEVTLVISSSEDFGLVNGVNCRRWTGRDESSNRYDVFVAMIVPVASADRVSVGRNMTQPLKLLTPNTDATD